MLQDARDLPDGHLLEADVCLAGAGAAGITLALELAGSGLTVVLLESGGLKAEKSAQALYDGTVADERLHSPLVRYRERRFGGSTAIWGGRCVPLDPIDFEARPYLPDSGWPFPAAALQPYYARASKVCEAGPADYSVDTAFPGGLPPMMAGFASRDFTTDTLERYSCPTHFGERYLEALRAAPGIRVLLHANLGKIALDGSGAAVRAVVARTLGGRSVTIQAKRYVLAMGGLEIPRVLLANRGIQPNGIGNAHDLVGRYYMCHIAGTVGTLALDGPRGTVAHGYDRADGGIYCRRRIALTAAAQRRLGIGNFIARLHHPRITDPAHRTGVLSMLYLAKPFIPYEYARRLHGGAPGTWRSWLQHVRNVASDPGDTAAFLWHLLRDRRLASRKFPSIIVRPRTNRFSLDFHSEQQPNFASRVTLGPGRDALDMPRLHVDWRHTEWDIRTVRSALDLFAADVRTSGIGTYHYDRDALEAEVLRDGAYGGHHLGTARMGTDRRTSVVDADGRVHGVRNLHVAGGAIFPTSSQANPTLTIVALAVRLADHLKVELAREAQVATPHAA